MARALFFVTTIWGALNCVVFIVGYHRHSRGTWRVWPMGRHIMGLIVALLAIMLLVTVYLIFGSQSHWLWVVSLIILNVFLTQRNYYLFTDKWRSSISDPSEDTLREIRQHKVDPNTDGG